MSDAGDGAGTGPGSDRPSLLRIGLSAGFAALSRRRADGGGSIGNGNGAPSDPDYSSNPRGADVQNGSSPENKNKRRSLLSTDDEERSVRSILETARSIDARSSSDASLVRGGASHDPVTVAALSAMGGGSTRSAAGVLVNVIDPTTPPPDGGDGGAGGGVGGGVGGRGGVTYNSAPPGPPPPDTPPASSGVIGGGKGFFGSLVGQDGGKGRDSSGSNGGAAGGGGGGASCANLRLFSRLATTFDNNYASTLRSLPYRHPRTNSKGTIPHLPVRLGLTCAPSAEPQEWHANPYCHVYLAAVENVEHYRAKVRPAIRAFVNQIEGSGTTASAEDGTGSGPGGGAGGGGGAPGSSPAKVRGAKRSANERALSRAGLGAARSSAAGNFGSRYVIVYVPVGPGGTSGSNHSSAGVGTPGGFGGFRGKKGVVVTGEGDNSANGANSDAAAPPPGPVAHTSREVKELYAKFAKDFPNGRTVILGTLLDGKGAALSPRSSVSPLQNQEWKAFLHNLGGCVVDGFLDRVRRYDEELRRLDSHRAAFVRKLSGGGDGGASSNGSGGTFDLGNFFLVKESLAFTYEQVQMPSEARMQYGELDAFLPEDAWRRLAAGSDGEGGGGGDGGADDDEVRDLAAAGDSAGFRRRVRMSSDRNLRDVSRHVPPYMHAREVRLLFRMGDPVEVLASSRGYLDRGYRDRLLDVSSEYGADGGGDGGEEKGEEDAASRRTDLRRRLEAEAEAEAWALRSCWDVRTSASGYFSSLDRDAVDRPSRAAGGGADARAGADAAEEREAARCLAELLEFAILRLMRLGDLALLIKALIREDGEGGTDELPKAVNPIRRATSERPSDTLRPWEPWRELRGKDERGGPKRGENGGGGNGGADGEGSGGDDWPPVLSPSSAPSWLLSALAGPSPYESLYLELAEAAAHLNRRAGRRRLASRLEDHRAEVLMARGDHAAACRVLSSNAFGACARDQWTRAHYWRIFRLACCQRRGDDVLAYLETLTKSFDPRLRGVAPGRTAGLFQRDLEALVADSAVADPRWGAFPFLETELSIDGGGGGRRDRTSQPLPFLRRKLTKHVCSVGERLEFTLRINSHLPRPISVNGVRLYLVTLERYERVYRRDSVVAEDDAFRILNLDAPIEILPGENEFRFGWRPMTVASYVLATVEIQWKEAGFFYDSALLRRPMIGLDVRPSEPTQTIELNPLFLIPGHVQNVRLVFHSGSDIITEGVVRLACSDGLQVVPPNTDAAGLDGAWGDECVIPLEACGPGKKIVITTLVKSSTVRQPDGGGGGEAGGDDDDDDAAAASGDGGGGVQTMEARVETRYRQESYTSVMEEGEEPESEPMSTILEAMVTTLDRPALTVVDADSFAFGEDHVMVSVRVQCNSPVPFYIKEWHLDLPRPLAVEDDGDLNRDMYRHAIPEGEVLLFGFRCTRVEGGDAGGDHVHERPILRVVLQDDFGKTFLQVLPVDLGSMYKKLRKEDAYSEMYQAVADLTCSADEGTVGHPVPFSYRLDLRSLVTPRARKRATSDSESLTSLAGRPILYTIASEGSDWIVSGKVQGLVELSETTVSTTLDFRAIPTKSGILRRFPELYLEDLPAASMRSPGRAVKVGGGAQQPPITVQCRNPEGFRSLAYTTSLSLAVPATLEEF